MSGPHRAFTPSSVLAERDLQRAKQTVAITLNAALRELDRYQHTAVALKRMKHDVETCREALQILLKPKPAKSLGGRRRKDFIDFEDLTGEQ